MHNPRPLTEDEEIEFDEAIDRLHVFDAATGRNVLPLRPAATGAH